MTCLLCGNPRPTEVRVSLARWRDPGQGMFSTIPRCIDRAACRRRVEENGDEYEVIDPGEPSVVPGGVS